MFWCALRFLLFEKINQRNCIKFCVENEIKCKRTFEMFTVTFEESTMNRTEVQLLYNRFTEGREDINGNAHMQVQDNCHMQRHLKC